MTRNIYTLLLAGFLLPNIKDTSKLNYNYYSLSADLKVAPNYYSTKTGFFCNTERSFEKQTKLPVKFRLGSVEQTQKLEGYNLSRNTQH
jgi:hypothetical protein